MEGAEIPRDEDKPLEYLIKEEFSGAAREIPDFPHRPSIQETHNVCAFVVSELVEMLQNDHTIEEIQYLLQKWSTKDLSKVEKPTCHEEYTEQNEDARVDIKYYIDDNSAKNGMNLYKFGRVVHEMNLDKKDPKSGEWIIRESDQKIMKRKNWAKDNKGKTLKETNRQIEEGSWDNEGYGKPHLCGDNVGDPEGCGKCYYTHLNKTMPLTLKDTPDICQKCGNKDCEELSSFSPNEICFYYDLMWNHPPTDQCGKDDDCYICSIRDCPYNEPLHHHHDGCPSCYSSQSEVNNIEDKKEDNI